MKIGRPYPWIVGSLLLPLLGLAAGCYDAPGKPVSPPPKAVTEPAKPTTIKSTRLGRDVYLERLGKGKTEHRRVLVDAHVCLREGSYALETFLCRSGTKEHESVLATEADARLIHAGLVAAGAEPGHPVRFFPNKPPETATGTRILVGIRYKDKGKEKTVRAQNWIMNLKTKKPLAQDWVFAGSVLWQDPDDPKAKPRYLANDDGAYICVTDVPTAMLALPINSTNRPEDRQFQFNTPLIPEIGTKVTLILEPKKE